MLTRKGLIYLGGVVLLGFFYYPLKRLASSALIFFIGALCYLILLRLLAERLDRRT